MSIEDLVANTLDQDGDKIAAAHDCDDLDASRYPGAFDIMCDAIDQNCDGYDSCDRDRDGFVDNADCAPDDPKITSDCWPRPNPAPLL
jgi:hypothetical protein